MLCTVKMYLNSLKDRQTSSCRSKQRRDKLLERRRNAGPQSCKPRLTRFSTHSANNNERPHKFERWGIVFFFD